VTGLDMREGYARERCGRGWDRMGWVRGRGWRQAYQGCIHHWLSIHHVNSITAHSLNAIKASHACCTSTHVADGARCDPLTGALIQSIELGAW